MIYPWQSPSPQVALEAAEQSVAAQCATSKTATSETTSDLDADPLI